MRRAIVISGRHEATDERYQPIVAFLRDHGYVAELFEPDWERNTLQELLEDFFAYNKNQPVDVLIGFSLGGMLGLLISNKQEIGRLILCSPSGFFAEYKKLLPLSDKQFARQSQKDYSKFSAVEAVRQSRAKEGVLIAGELEISSWPDFRAWIHDLQQWSNWPLTIVQATKHTIEAPSYQRTIIEAVTDT